MPISSLAKIGLNMESTWGAGGSPDIVLPIESWNLTGPYEQVLDNAKRGVIAKDFNAYQGIGRAEGSFDGEVFPDLFGYVLKSLFGTLVTTGGTPYTHTFTFSGTPPSICLTEDNAVRQHQGQGLLVSELGLTLNPTEGALMYSASMLGKQLGTVSYTFPSETQESTPFMLGWQGSVDLDGSLFPVIEADINFSREVVLHYRLENSQYAGTAYAAAPEVTGSFTIDYTAGSEYDRYRLHQQGSVNIYYYLDADRTLTLELGSVDFGDGPAEIDKSGASMMLSYTWRGLYVSALGGPGRAILVCNTATF